MDWKIVTCEVALIASCVLLIFKDLECCLVWTILGVAMFLPCVALGCDIFKQRQKIKQENERIKQQWELDREFNDGVKLRKDFCEWMAWKKAQDLSISEINEEFKQYKEMFHSDADKTE